MFLCETSRRLLLLFGSFLLLASDCRSTEFACAQEVEHDAEVSASQQASLLQTASRSARVIIQARKDRVDHQQADLLHNVSMTAPAALSMTAPAAALDETIAANHRQGEVVEQAQPFGPVAAAVAGAAAASVAGFKVSESLHLIFMSASSQTVASLTLVVATGVFALAWWWPAEKNSVVPGSRSTLLDNAKVVAQFLVIYCNMLNNNLLPDRATPEGYSDWQTWLSGSQELLRALLDGLSAVMIPMLCFISGVLSQGPTNERRMRRFLEVLVVPVLLWVYLAKPIIYETMMDPSLDGLRGRLKAVVHLQSFHEEWYLQALILWRGSVFVLWSHFRAGVALVSMFLLSGLAGYLNLNGPLWYLKLDETLGFLPYFALGYFFPFDAARKLTERRRVPWVVAIGLVIVWIFGLLPMVGPLPNSHGNYQCCAAGPIFRELQSIDYKLYWTRRLARVALEMPPTLLLIFYVVPRSETPLSWVGRHMLYPYLFHRVANHWRSHLVHYLQPPVITHTAGHVAVLALHAPYVIGLLVMFASRPWRMLFAWCLEPTWLKPVLASSRVSKHVRALRWHNAAQKAAVPSSGSDLPTSAWEKHNHEGRADGDASCPRPHRGDERCAAHERHRDFGDAQSNPELCGSSRPASSKWQSTGPELPWQEVAKKYYPWLWCIFSVAAVIPSVAFLIAIFVWPGLDLLLRLIDDIPVALSIVIWVLLLTFTGVNYIWHYFRLHRSDDLPEPTGAPPLQHAVVVVAYKEPLDVLTRTMDSIVAQRGLSRRPIVVFASEDRDHTAQDAFTSLSQHVGDHFDSFLMTKHELVNGETVGKSSNENHAVKELYDRLVEEQGRDPFEILVTIVDADSILSSTYLAHSEAAYRNMSDGRRFIYSGPLNVHRNFSDADLLVQAYELNRCHIDMFHNPFVQYQPQSNYSIALGFAQEVGFWTPDVMPEDIHTANRACVHNFGSYTTVAIPSIICNDVVTDFWDRYTQAKRHQWGSLTEFAWSLALFFNTRKMTFQAWWPVFRVESSREGSFLDIAQALSGWICKLLCCYALCQRGISWKMKLFFFMYLSISVWRWLWFWAAELLVWQTLLVQFPIRRPSLPRWFLLVFLMPVLLFIGTIVFYLGASLHCLVRITTVGDLTYIAAPKGDASTGKTHNSKPDQASEKAPDDLPTRGGICFEDSASVRI
mmetsp:Transcript_77598/g.137402  ORF Transcript_77598/g.137402 Transcript_77598/m.137402 type:complete len:1179 (+) Transcript_77598:52-3588(+)